MKTFFLGVVSIFLIGCIHINIILPESKPEIKEEKKEETPKMYYYIPNTPKTTPQDSPSLDFKSPNRFKV